MFRQNVRKRNMTALRKLKKASGFLAMGLHVKTASRPTIHIPTHCAQHSKCNIYTHGIGAKL